MNCEQIHELLEAYALGALDADSVAMVEKHLAECAECRELAEEFAGIANRLPQVLAMVSPLRPPDSMKDRLFDAIEADATTSVKLHDKPTRTIPIRVRRRYSRYTFQRIGSAVALVLLMFSVVWIAHLSTALAHEQNLRERLEHQTELIFEVVDSDQTTRRFLQPTENAPRLPDAGPPYGKVFTRADLPYVVAMTGRLPAPPAGQVYNLWLFSEGRSVLAGTIMPDDAGFDSLLFQANDDGPLYESAQLILQDEASDTPSGIPVLAWQLNQES